MTKKRNHSRKGISKKHSSSTNNNINNINNNNNNVLNFPYLEKLRHCGDIEELQETLISLELSFGGQSSEEVKALLAYDHGSRLVVLFDMLRDVSLEVFLKVRVLCILRQLILLDERRMLDIMYDVRAFLPLLFSLFFTPFHGINLPILNNVILDFYSTPLQTPAISTDL